MKINLDTYIISDTHFGHDNIIKYCNRPEDHDFLMELYWKSIVQPEDTILHLGDLAFKNNVVSLNSLPGKKYLMIGNHDHKSKEWYADNGFTVVPKRVFFNYGSERILFTHYPENNFDIHWDVNIHGHIHNKGWTKKEEDGRHFINVSVEIMKYTPVQLKYILSGEV